MSVVDDQPEVIVSRNEGSHVATITFRRGEHNFFNLDLLKTLVETIEGIAETDARAIVLRSGGRQFCAGMNFGPNNFEERTGEHIHDSVVPRLFAQPLPLIAMIDGAAIGGGFGLAFAADFRIATPRARFTANFSRIGVNQGFGLSASLPWALGEQRAAELLLTGRRIGGQEAFEMGVCDRLVEPEDLERTAYELAEEMATASPLAVRSIREMLRRPLLARLKDVLQEERESQRALRLTEDFREGVTAYGERRVANFVGK